MFVVNKGELKPYWVNTSDNALIKRLIAQSGDEVKEDFAILLAGGVLKKEIDESMVFPGIEHDPKAIWSLFCLRDI